MLGGFFRNVCEYLPFEAAVKIIKGVMNNNIEIITNKNILIFSCYTIAVLILSIIIFKRKMISDNK